jgi:hypothetical protein
MRAEQKWRTFEAAIYHPAGTTWRHPKHGLTGRQNLAHRRQSSQPDRIENATLFTLLDAENTAGVKLTESSAMWPGSSVSGLYFSHPESYYFGVGKIERDQVRRAQ